jgi:hypothetical protein
LLKSSYKRAQMVNQPLLPLLVHPSSVFMLI